MITEPSSTYVDLKFHLFGIHVRIHPMFWLVAILLGWDLPIAEQMVWVVVAFCSIFFHEITKALSVSLIKRKSRIILHKLGGLTIIERNQDLHLGWEEAVPLGSGTLARFLLAGIAYTLAPILIDTGSGIGGAFYYHFLWLNIVWGVANLLPIWPLDGGQFIRLILVHCAGDKGFSFASLLSFITAGIAAFVAWQFNETYIAIFFAYFALVEWETSL